MQYETDTTTRKGKTSNLKTKSFQLEHNKYSFMKIFFLEDSPIFLFWGKPGSEANK